MRYAFLDYVLDTDAHVLQRAGFDQKIEPQVFDMLMLLVENAGNLVTRDQLVDKIWKGRIVSESAISARIAATRKAVGDDGKRQAIIRTIARRGLQFVAKLKVEEDIPPVDDTRTTAASDIPLHAKIRFTTAPDGGQIAWAETGEGPPILISSFFPSHLEIDLKVTDIRELILSFPQNRVIRFDPRGCGLSDWDMPDDDATMWSGEQKFVADAAGLDRFAIVARSGGVLRAVHFAAKYPERVNCLILQGGFVDGRSVRKGANYDPDHEPIEVLIREGWGVPDSPFMEAFGSVYLPTMSRAQLRETMVFFNQSANAKNALRVRRATNNLSISAILPKVKAPTLVIHSSRDAVHPISEARKLAAGIENSELLVLDSPNSVLFEKDPVWPDYIDAMRRFLNLHAK
jgi:pimeloyl-ACP methyl ester carboxylesterase/DNA-binding winged helix-turn-helix (wHTH) protein